MIQAIKIFVCEQLQLLHYRTGDPWIDWQASIGIYRTTGYAICALEFLEDRCVIHDWTILNRPYLATQFEYSNPDFVDLLIRDVIRINELEYVSYDGDYERGDLYEHYSST